MDFKRIIFYNLLWMCFFIHITFAVLPQSVIDLMASRHERYHHFLWHNIRNNWNLYDADTQGEITNRGWAPPRPALDFDADGNAFAITDNNSGEDFLYMHRQMIARARAVGGDIEELRGWTSVPAPGDTEWPVPPDYTIPDDSDSTAAISRTKTNSFYKNNIVPMEERFNDTDELRSMTLGELGSRIEFSIHNWLHTRFSEAESYGYRPEDSGAFPYIDPMWDDPAYDWLGDTYSSHVNPVFWKLHGWIDGKIEAWRIANGLDAITWTGTWEGGPMSTLSDIIEPRAPDESDVSLFGGDSVPERKFTDPVGVDLS